MFSGKITNPSMIQDFMEKESVLGGSKIEGVDEIKEHLFKWAIGHILRGSCGGLPEWYKERLMKSQFNTGPSLATEKQAEKRQGVVQNTDS